jgi:hypothetical protein
LGNPVVTAAKPVFRPKPHAIEALFGRRKVVIGVVHSLPLPGSPDYDGAPVADIVAFAVAEARRYRDGGVDGLIVENHGDIPFAKPEHLGPETAACMAVMTDAVRRAVALPIGVNVLANGVLAAMLASGAEVGDAVRVAQQAAALTVGRAGAFAALPDAAELRAIPGLRRVP